MNPNMTFAFIGGPRVAMQIMKLYQKREERQLFAYTNIIRERGENTHCYTLLQKKKVITVLCVTFLVSEKCDS